MRFFNRNERDPEDTDNGDPFDVPNVVMYTPEMLTKRLLWDLVPCSDVEAMMPLMNLSPESPDVRDMEHRSSHERMATVMPLGEILSLLTPLVSGITASAMLINSGVPADEASAVALQRHHSNVLQAGVGAILANLFDMGIITYTEGTQFGE
jgi:hypothetical protein